MWEKSASLSKAPTILFEITFIENMTKHFSLKKLQKLAVNRPFSPKFSGYYELIGISFLDLDKVYISLHR